MHLSGNSLKWIVIIAMLVDHIAWLFVGTETWLGQAMHFIGRFTAPTMCFFLVEGFYFTHSRIRYLLRLFVFAIISQFPFIYMQQQAKDEGLGWQGIIENPHILFEQGNVLFNLLLALLALIAWQLPFKRLVRGSMIALLLLFSAWMDWGIYLIVFTLVLAASRHDRKQQIMFFLMTGMGLLLLTDAGVIIGMPTVVLNWFPFGILAVSALWYCYDGTRGKNWGGRYFFYIFYPAHMLLLSLIAQYY